MEREGGGELGAGEDAVAEGRPGAADAGGESEGQGGEPRQYVLEKIFADQIDLIGAGATPTLSPRLRGPLVSRRGSSGRILASSHDRGEEDALEQSPRTSVQGKSHSNRTSEQFFLFKLAWNGNQIKKTRY